MTVYVPTDRERECRRLLEDAREAVERLERIADEVWAEIGRPVRCADRRRLSDAASEALRVLRGKIEDAEALVRQWGR